MRFRPVVYAFPKNICNILTNLFIVMNINIKLLDCVKKQGATMPINQNVVRSREDVKKVFAAGF